ncbi:MAG: type II secretion system ATPase GspE [Phycisphaerae bacterium]
MTRASDPHPTPPEKEADSGSRDQMEFAELWRPKSEGTSRRNPERLLLEMGAVTREQIVAAQKKQKSSPHLTLLEVLVQSRSISEKLALQVMAKYSNLPFMELKSQDVDERIFSLLSIDYLKSKKVIPIRRCRKGVLVGLADPTDIFLIDDLKRRFKNRAELVVVPPSQITLVIEELSTKPEEQMNDIIKDIAEDAVEVVESEEDEVTDLEELAGESPVIRYVNYVISQAVKEGASDIHIEPTEKRLRVRYRIDGVLFAQQAPPVSMQPAIISRLKIMANLDIAERRLPQDGRIRASVHGRNIDLRVSTLPVVHGEKCVIRLLDNRSITVGLDKLGFRPNTLEMFRHEITQPHGIVLVTGPTGSGKSTTLYSAIQVMDSDTLNISTVEDPVEYELDSINQVNVRERIGMSFSAALRSLLRQDPDVVMLGEIRDAETAKIAIQASLTGHLVLSTLHTNDAPSSITRLINIGVEPFLISAALNAILAQRLVRRICPECKQKVTELKPNEERFIKKYGLDVGTIYRGAGCDNCRDTGYKGRLGIYELLVMDEDIRDVVTGNPTLSQMRKAANDHGMETLRDDGLFKVQAGLTTIEEILRVTES